jgi:ADP-heptose:LPS heptosyltransferase
MSDFIDRSLVQRILLIKLRGIGDVLLSTVVAGNLRRAFPEARIDFLTKPSAVDVVQGNPHIDRIVVYDRAMMSGAALIQRVRSDAYDLVIDLFGNPRTALVTRLSRARYRVGYRCRGRTFAYNIVVEPRGASLT